MISGQQLYTIATALNGGLATAGIILAWVQRIAISNFFTSRAALHARVIRLLKENAELRSTLEGSKSAAEMWEAASQGRDAVLHRLEIIETVIPKFNASLLYIRTLSAHIAVLESILAKNGMELPQLPPVPHELLGDLRI